MGLQLCKNLLEMNRLILYGASGHAKVIFDAIKLNDQKEVILVDDNPAVKSLGELVVLSSGIIEVNDRVLISIGNNKTRHILAERLGVNFFSVVHPNAVIAKSVEIGEGTFIAAGVVINPDTSIGQHVIINTSASIDHDCRINDFVHVAPNATLCGGILVGEGSLIGAGATVIPNLKIGKWSTIGAGAVVTSDVPDNTVVVGNPARIIKTNE